MPPTMNSEVRLVDAKAVAKLLDISERQLYRLADSGRVPWGIKIGRLRRWNVAEIEQFILTGCKAKGKF